MHRTEYVADQNGFRIVSQKVTKTEDEGQNGQRQGRSKPRVTSSSARQGKKLSIPVTSSKRRQGKQQSDNKHLTFTNRREAEPTINKPVNSNSRGQIGWSGKRLYNGPYYFARSESKEENERSSKVLKGQMNENMIPSLNANDASYGQEWIPIKDPYLNLPEMETSTKIDQGQTERIKMPFNDPKLSTEEHFGQEWIPIQSPYSESPKIKLESEKVAEVPYVTTQKETLTTTFKPRASSTNIQTTLSITQPIRVMPKDSKESTKMTSTTSPDSATTDTTGTLTSMAASISTTENTSTPAQTETTFKENSDTTTKKTFVTTTEVTTSAPMTTTGSTTVDPKTETTTTTAMTPTVITETSTSTTMLTIRTTRAVPATETSTSITTTATTTTTTARFEDMETTTQRRGKFTKPTRKSETSTRETNPVNSEEIFVPEEHEIDFRSLDEYSD
jgi:hypothetical protein